MAVSVVSLVAVLGAGLVLARALGVENRGSVAIVLVWATLSLDFGSLGTMDAVAYHSRSVKSLGTLTRIALVPVAVIVAIYAVVVALGVMDAIGRDAIVLGTLLAVAMYVHELLLRFHHGRGELRRVNAMRLMRTAGGPVLIVGLGAAGQLSIASALGAYLVATLVSLGLGSLATNVATESSAERLDVANFARYCVDSFGTIAAKKINRGADLLLITIISTRTDVGLYTVGVSTTVAILALTESYELRAFANAVSLPRLKPCSHYVRSAVVVSVGLGVAYVLVAPALIPVLYGADFEGSARIGQALVPGVVFFSVSRVLAAELRASGHPRLVAIADLAGGVVTVGLALASWGDPVLTALASSAGYGISLAGMARAFQGSDV